VTWHEAAVPLPTSVQLVAPKLPPPLVVQLTVPVGALFVPESVSLTVTVQVVVSPACAVGPGEHNPLVLVVRLLIASVPVPLLAVNTALPL
jgi:hypothetical protein